MHDFNFTDKATKVIWIKYFHENTHSLWENYILESAGVKNMNIIFRSNFSEYMILAILSYQIFIKIYKTGN